MTAPRKKLIEVALPLEAINREAAREKSIRHGHPSTLHLWWARRPLAAARAVIFAQMVDDPSSVPEEFPTPEAQEEERQRLFRLIEELVLWENTTNEEVLNRARAEIKRSWARWCRREGTTDKHGSTRIAEGTNPRPSVSTRGSDIPPLPPFHDPFAGGGALPLEAQRLGLEAHASDLNPVAVMINKAMIEIPPRFAGRPPINPEWRTTDEHESTQMGKGPNPCPSVSIRGSSIRGSELIGREWKGAQGLAEDVRYYGQWMRDEAEKRIGHLYPKAKVTAEMAKDRPDLKPYVGRELTVIAWLWARTVESSNPAYRGRHVPLVSSFWLSTKPGKEAWIEVERGTTDGHGWTRMEGGKEYRFVVRSGKPRDKAAVDAGTKLGRGANFRCVLSDSPLSPDYIKAEGMAGRMGARLMAIVCEGDRGRVYLPPTEEHEQVAKSAKPKWNPEGDLPINPRWFSPPDYGMPSYADLFTPRQLVALTTFSDLVAEAREKILEDAGSAGFQPAVSEKRAAKDGGAPSVADYAAAVSVYLAFAISKLANLGSTVTSWMSDRGAFRETFARQAIPMVWDYAEANAFSSSGGSLDTVFSKIASVLDLLPCGHGVAMQANATAINGVSPRIFSSDPPYYDNIGYADLSDFFYVWMRNSLKSAYPELFGTLLVPKAEELVATPYRHGSKDKAEAFFLDGMTKAVHAMAEQAHAGFPVTIYYAFKQAEGDVDGTSSTGWETFLDAVIRAGFAITGTWPMRTEGAGRLIGLGTNALASSIVLVCRPRPADAPTTTRKDFLAALRRELPPALRHLQEGNIAPVDLAQASIGPGMAVFSRYSKILETDGKPMTVRTALQLINQTLDEVLAEQEGDFDPETAWAVAWFEQFGFNDGPFGDAETLSKAKNTALNALVEAGIVKTGAGKTRLLKPGSAAVPAAPGSAGVPPASLLKHPTVWMFTHLLISALETGGETAAAELLKTAGETPALPGGDTARELAYRLYSVCERRKRAAEALSYNALVQSWPEIARLARESGKPKAEQGELL